MKKLQVSTTLDPELYERVEECAKADKRSLAHILQLSVMSGIEEVEETLVKAGRLPVKKKPRAGSNVSTVTTSHLDRIAV